MPKPKTIKLENVNNCSPGNLHHAGSPEGAFRALEYIQELQRTGTVVKLPLRYRIHRWLKQRWYRLH